VLYSALTKKDFSFQLIFFRYMAWPSSDIDFF